MVFVSLCMMCSTSKTNTQGWKKPLNLCAYSILCDPYSDFTCLVPVKYFFLIKMGKKTHFRCSGMTTLFIPLQWDEMIYCALIRGRGIICIECEQVMKNPVWGCHNWSPLVLSVCHEDLKDVWVFEESCYQGFRINVILSYLRGR